MPLCLCPQRRSEEKSQKRHDNVMHMLIRRYVTAEQRKRDDFGITEDDVMEIRQDISTLRYELIDILRSNGMKTPQVQHVDMSSECEWLPIGSVYPPEPVGLNGFHFRSNSGRQEGQNDGAPHPEGLPDRHRRGHRVGRGKAVDGGEGRLLIDCEGHR